jgi:hypothetical protein
MPVGVRDAANQVAIGAGVGGIEYVLAAMRRYPDGAGVQESCCGALGNLAFANAANLAVIAGAGGIEAVLSALRRCCLRCDATLMQLVCKSTAVVHWETSR